MLDGARAGTELEPQGERPIVGCLGHQSFLVLPIFFPSLSLTLGAEALGALGNTNIRQYWGGKKGLTRH